MKIRFDHGPAGDACWFQDPSAMVVAQDAGDVPVALAALDAARRSGKWLAGFASYELGYVFEDRLLPRLPTDRALPLLAFGIYDGPTTAAALVAGGALRTLTPRWSEHRYARAFASLHDHIGAGDIYQANLTFPIDAEVEGTPEGLYAALAERQPVGYGALLLHHRFPALLSRSPELFFRTDADGVIETKPMKGTQPRVEDPVEDARLREFLASDQKNRAENLMIVDLLRNDISRIAAPSSVHVPELFKVESYETVHQMVSLVRAKLGVGVQLSDIFKALFPCGSITGAPKLRAMEIIRDLEPWSREAYCGSIGWAAPDGASEFNVAIRTVMVEGDRAVLNVGGGVVWDSTAGSEYEEALWKARYAQMQALSFA